MKKLHTMLATAMVVAMPTLFASCDSDPWYDDAWHDTWTWGENYNHRPDNGNVDNDDFFVSMAQTLSGRWRGDMMAYKLDSKGNAIDSIYYTTDIEFKQYNSQSISGIGTQYDFNPKTEQLELQRDFSWYIDPKTGDIYMNYKEKNNDGSLSDYGMKIAYNDLNLDNRTFTGYLWANDGYEIDDFLFKRYTRSSTASHKTVVKIKMVMK